MIAITRSEDARLQKLERTIERGKKAFIEVGIALKEIRDDKLYRSSHGTFAKYVEERFGFKRAVAYHYIEAADVSGNVTNGDIIQNDRQAREVAKAPPEKQTEVVERAAEIAAERGKEPTAAIFAEARETVLGEIVDESDDFEEYEDYEPDEPNRIGELVDRIESEFEPYEWRVIAERLLVDAGTQ